MWRQGEHATGQWCLFLVEHISEKVFDKETYIVGMSVDWLDTEATIELLYCCIKPICCHDNSIALSDLKVLFVLTVFKKTNGVSVRHLEYRTKYFVYFWFSVQLRNTLIQEMVDFICLFKTKWCLCCVGRWFTSLLLLFRRALNSKNQLSRCHDLVCAPLPADTRRTLFLAVPTQHQPLWYMGL